MSGPKGYSVRVESAAERLRRETNAAQARCNALNDRLAGLRAVAATDVAECEAPQQRTLKQLKAWEQRLQRAIAAGERAVDSQRARSRMAAMASTAGLEALRSVALGETRSAGPARTSARTQTSVPEQTREELASKVADLLGRASEVDDQTALDSLTVQAKALLNLQGPALTRGWTALESSVVRAVKLHRAQRRCLSQAESEVLRIAHLEGAEADAIRAAAASVRDEAGLAALRAQVAQAVVDADRRADAAFVTEQARLALADLGYAVDGPFEVPQEACGFVARRSDLPNHGLRVLVSQATGRMLTSVVAAAGTSPAEDTAAEEATCADVFAFASAMADRGVLAELGPHAEPGETGLEHSLPGTARVQRKSQKKRTRRVQQPKAMGMRP